MKIITQKENPSADTKELEREIRAVVCKYARNTTDYCIFRKTKPQNQIIVKSANNRLSNHNFGFNAVISFLFAALCFNMINY
jgi:hypothetical protein